MNIPTVHNKISTIFYLFIYLFILSKLQVQKKKQEMALTKIYNSVTVMLQY